MIDQLIQRAGPKVRSGCSSTQALSWLTPCYWIWWQHLFMVLMLHCLLSAGRVVSNFDPKHENILKAVLVIFWMKFNWQEDCSPWPRLPSQRVFCHLTTVNQHRTTLTPPPACPGSADGVWTHVDLCVQQLVGWSRADSSLLLWTPV